MNDASKAKSLFDLGLVVVTKTPDGEAPLEIRKRWVGIEIPCLCFSERSDSASGVLSGGKLPQEPRYIVSQTDALETLEKVDPEAARWWRDRGFPKHPMALFSFRAEEVRVLVRPPTEKEVEATIHSLFPYGEANAHERN